MNNMRERDLDLYRVYLLGWLARLYFETGRWKEAESEADLIPGARIVTAANVVEQLVSGAASMSF